jgi:hypothetical protein
MAETKKINLYDTTKKDKKTKDITSKVIVPTPEGAYNIADLQVEYKRGKAVIKYEAIVKALKEDKAYVMPEKLSRNTIYTIMAKLQSKEKDGYAMENVFWAKIKTSKQFVLYHR